MKIALLLSGNLRQFMYKEFYEKTIAEIWQSLIVKHDIDVFCYTDTNDFYFDGTHYFTDSSFTVTNNDQWRLHNNHKIIEECDAQKLVENCLQSTFGKYLKNCVINPYVSAEKYYCTDNIYHNEFIKYNSGRSISHKYALLSQFYKRKKVYELMCAHENLNNFKYDVVISCRFDCVICKVDLFNLDCRKNVYCSGTPKYIYDWWAVGDRFIMEKYCNYYDEISSNLIDQNYCFIKDNDETFYTNNADCAKIHDISDSAEVGLTHMLKKCNYNPSYGIEYDMRKTYSR